jgi:hypothetical protein
VLHHPLIKVSRAHIVLFWFGIGMTIVSFVLACVVNRNCCYGIFALMLSTWVIFRHNLRVIKIQHADAVIKLEVEFHQRWRDIGR